MPLYLTEADVTQLVDPAAALPVIEECFRRLAAGEVDVMPRQRLGVEGGSLAVMAAADRGLRVAGSKTYIVVDGRASFVVSLFSAEDASLIALLEADRLGQVRTGAATGVAAKYLARSGATSVGLIGSGWQAESQLAAVRAAVPTIERALVWSRSRDKVESFCARTGADAAESPQEVATCDVVVTATNSKDPVLRGDWLRDGALVCAVGANDGRSRELDNAVLERASFVCCDWLEDAKVESGDLIEPVTTGVLDWLEVHQFHEVVAGETAGRQADGDIVVFKSNGIAPWDIALAADVVRRALERGGVREL